MRAFSSKLPPKTSDRRWLKTLEGRFHTAYTKHREVFQVRDALEATAAELGITFEKAHEIWSNRS